MAHTHEQMLEIERLRAKVHEQGEPPSPVAWFMAGDEFYLDPYMEALRAEAGE